MIRMKEDESSNIISGTVEGISNMSIRGAGKIAKAASTAISEYAQSWIGTSRDEMIEDLKRVARTLLSTRPTAVSLRNGILLTLMGTEDLHDIGSVREMIATRSRKFVEGAEQARERISEIGSLRVPKGSTVMTHCNSMAALSTIEKAFRDGRVEMVYSTESRPWRQGHITTKWLLEREIPVTMIVDSAVRHFMRKMDVVMVGADTITSHGAVINKIGTSQIALSAHESRVPLMVCAETFKFSRETLFGSPVEIEDRGPSGIADPMEPRDFEGAHFRNPVFDITPPEHIDAIITELGVISPYLAAEIIREVFGIVGPDPGNEKFKWLD
ncbi:MAG: ribose 1,5-bisphosphate isomerase [Candidatus Thermoplasmatota archaeon]|nr:ribose 1,5-bisphosphate isomerase [Candidatus Thermoplasmatota archaeon]